MGADASPARFVKHMASRLRDSWRWGRLAIFSTGIGLSLAITACPLATFHQRTAGRLRRGT
jgi:hypothetical protein